MKNKTLYLTIIIVSIIGLLIASYLTYTHYQQQIIFCDINSINSCHNVLNGPYSELFFNIPNSLIGALGFLLLGILGYLGLRNYKKEINKLLLIFSSISLIFILYLAYLIFFVIHSFCIYCFTTWILVIIIFICSILLNKK